MNSILFFSQIFVKNYNLNLLNFVTPEFLFFSWKQIKVKTKMHNMFFEKKFFYPPSRLWFIKTSLLIRKSNFYYSYLFTSTFVSSFLDNLFISSFINLKFLIIQNAFLILMKPFFYNLGRNSYNLSKYLRTELH